MADDGYDEEIAVLRAARDTLAGFDAEGAGAIRRAGELGAVREQLRLCAARLSEDPELKDVLERLLLTDKALASAQKAGRRHRRMPLTRPLSHVRFAFSLGSSQGGVMWVLSKLTGEPLPESGCPVKPAPAPDAKAEAARDRAPDPSRD
ncbi:hypothetical protein V1L54_04430 [Streptomyces sp. TRM 70361]|uniref:hypothetical protein n=1 Tax=Streptomyces sp. TRM 70361 TaxID=3116553 RepID=UPI002E7BFA5B|nr:hypothetical protein [Streptomyces sp. TRM 70361]MEE1938664.1 hypothetical protein [Streptomyces sp. TRM 70361]